MKAIDFLGNEINVEDEVVFIQKSYRELKIGKIISITEKTLLIEHEKFNRGGTTTKQFHNQVILKK